MQIPTPLQLINLILHPIQLQILTLLKRAQQAAPLQLLGVIRPLRSVKLPSPVPELQNILITRTADCEALVLVQRAALHRREGHAGLLPLAPPRLPQRRPLLANILHLLLERLWVLLLLDQVREEVPEGRVSSLLQLHGHESEVAFLALFVHFDAAEQERGWFEVDVGARGEIALGYREGLDHLGEGFEVGETLFGEFEILGARSCLLLGPPD